MKALINYSFLLLFFTTSLSSSTFAQKGLAAETDPFTAISAAAGVTVYLRQGETERIKVVGSDEDVEGLIVETKGNTLHVYYESRSGWKIGKVSRNAKVYVQVRDITSIEASSGSDVIGENLLVSKDLTVSASSGADVKIEVDAENLSLSTSSGSDIKASGKALALTASASSGSDIDAEGLQVNKATLSASSGADISVEVLEEVEAKASSGAEIRVSGNPVTKNIEESSTGDVYVK